MRSPVNWFLALCMAGIFAIVAAFFGPDFIAAVRSHTWPTAPCVILKSEVGQEPFSASVMHYVLRVEYTYVFGGREYRSNRFTTGKRQGSTEPERAERSAVRFAVGTHATCFVNPGHPEEAVLERGELWGGIILLLPAFLWLVLAHESIFNWWGERRRRRRAVRNLPLSEANDALRPDGRLIAFSIVALGVGGAFLGGCLVGPWVQWLQSRDWAETNAMITSCELASNHTQHGRTYSIKVLYEYEFAGGRHRSSQRAFGFSIEEPVTEMAAWVEAHPAGTPVRCFVNPRDPTEAVLERTARFGWVTFGFGVGMTIGGLIMLGKVAQIQWLRRRLKGERLIAHCIGSRRDGAAWLRVSPPPLLVAFACLLGAVPAGAVGNWSLQKGIAALRHGQSDLINLAYGAVATGGAVWLLFQCGKSLKRAWHPRPTLSITPGTPAVGDKFQVDWHFTGSRQTVNDLRIWLEGAEEVTVREIVPGMYEVSSEKKRRAVFAVVPVAHQSVAPSSGSVSTQVPPHAMHTFCGAKTSIVWQIHVEFATTGNGRLNYAFPVALLPQKL